MSETADVSRRGTLSLAIRYALRELRSGLRGFYVFIACIALGVMGVMAAGAYFIMARRAGNGDEVQTTVARIIGGCLLIMLAGPIVNALVS